MTSKFSLRDLSLLLALLAIAVFFTLAVPGYGFTTLTLMQILCFYYKYIHFCSSLYLLLEISFTRSTLCLRDKDIQFCFETSLLLENISQCIRNKLCIHNIYSFVWLNHYWFLETLSALLEIYYVFACNTHFVLELLFDSRNISRCARNIL